jgi:hypothetical protein
MVDREPISSLNGSKWITIVTPAIILGLLSVAFSVGLYVGRAEVQIELTELRSRVRTNELSLANVVPVNVMELRFQAVADRLARIESMLQSRLPAGTER